MKNLIKNLAILSAIVFAFASCNSDDTPDNKEGTVKVQLTDAVFPFDFVTQANVEVAKVELKTAEGEFITVFKASGSGNSTYNMVELTNGATAEVESTSLEEGTYTEARVSLSGASIHLSDDSNFDANFDGTDAITTVSIDPPLVVESGEDSNVLFDLDLQNSFGFQTGMGTWLDEWINSMAMITGCTFQPVFRVCDLDQTGKIEGTVTVGGTAFKNANVSIEVDGETINTHSEADGSFAFIGIKDGTYTVTAKTENDGTVQVGDITVSGNETATCSLNIN